MEARDVIDFLESHGVPGHDVATLTTRPDRFEVVRHLRNEDGHKYADESGTEVASLVEVWYYGDPPQPYFPEFEVWD